MDIEELTREFRRLHEISEEIRRTQSKLESLREDRADLFLYLRNAGEQTWNSIADVAELDYKRVIELANKRELYLARNPKPVDIDAPILPELDMEEMRRKLEEFHDHN